MAFACAQMGWTPLHAAISSFNVAATSVVELLLDAGAAVNARNGVRGVQAGKGASRTRFNFTFNLFHEISALS
jgi:hypothetical protein